MSTHINEEALGLNDLITDSFDSFDSLGDGIRTEIGCFLAKFYTWDETLGEFDDTPKPDYRPYEIKAKYTDECLDDVYVNIYSIRVSLPSDSDAKELADILDGEVVDGLNANCKEYTVTYTKQIRIKAQNEEQEKENFSDMSIAAADRYSTFHSIDSITAGRD